MKIIFTTLARFSSVDFCNLPSNQVIGGSRPGCPETFDYLKIRITDSSRPPELTAYMPLKQAGGLLRSGLYYSGVQA